MFRVDEVRTLRQALILRKMRNECSLYMTNETAQISRFRQCLFYIDNILGARDNYKCYLAYLGNQPIGYGLIRLDSSMITGGIVRRKRGFGHGESLFVFLTSKARELTGSSFLEVKEKNLRAIRLYKKLGYVTFGRKEGVLVMTTRYPHKHR